MQAAGKRSSRIRFERMVASEPKASGQIDRAPALLQEVWAERLEETSREVWLAKQIVAEITVGWRFLWSSTIAAVTPSQDYRVVDADGRVYDLLRVTPEGRREGLLVYGKGRAE